MRDMHPSGSASLASPARAAAALAAVLALFVALASLAMLSQHCPTLSDETTTEAFQDFRVLRSAPAADLVVIVPAHTYPDKNALSVLAPLLDVGITVRHAAAADSSAAARGSASKSARANASESGLALTDTLRFHRNRVPYEALATVVRDSQTRLCVFGNLRSAAARTSAASSNQPPRYYALTSLLDGSASNWAAAHSSTEKLRLLVRDDADLFALQSVLFATGAEDAQARVRSSNVRVEYFTDATTELPAALASATPTVVATLLEGEQHPVWGALKGVKTIWYGYDALRASRLKLVLPFAFVESVDVRAKLLTDVSGSQHEYSVVSFHAVLFGNTTTTSTNPLLRAALVALMFADRDRAIETVAANNFLGLYFPFLRISRALAKTTNDALYRKRYSLMPDRGLRVGIPRFSVLEQFAGAPDVDDAGKAASDVVSLPMHVNVPGDFVTSYGGSLKRLNVTLSKDEPMLRHVPLRRGDHVQLHAQRRPAENGAYYVTDAAPGRLVLQNRVTLTLDPSTDSSTTSVQGVDGLSHSLTVRADVRRHPLLARLAPGAGVLFPELGRGATGTVTRAASLPARPMCEIAVDASEGPLQDGKTDPLYVCTQAREVRVREQCEERGAVWDRPCERDAECPYYRANTLYTNHRGGCHAGYCEMPLGVELVGFRRIARDTPVCHASDASRCTREDQFRPGGCCATAAAAGAPPDYAFALDEFDRRASGLHE